MLGLVFAGSPSRIANGVRIAGVDVGGKTPGQAERILTVDGLPSSAACKLRSAAHASGGGASSGRAR